MIILNDVVNTGQRMEQEKTQRLMKDNEQKAVHSFFYKNNFKRIMMFPGQ